VPVLCRVRFVICRAPLRSSAPPTLLFSSVPSPTRCPACSPRHRHKAVVSWLRCRPAQLRDTSMLAAGSQLLTQFAGASASASARGCGVAGERRACGVGRLQACTAERPSDRAGPVPWQLRLTAVLPLASHSLRHLSNHASRLLCRLRSSRPMLQSPAAATRALACTRLA